MLLIQVMSFSFIIFQTQNGTYNGALWIGLNKLEDRVNYK